MKRKIIASLLLACMATSLMGCNNSGHKKSHHRDSDDEIADTTYYEETDDEDKSRTSRETSRTTTSTTAKPTKAPTVQLSAPKIVDYSIRGNVVTLKWDSVPDATEYHIIAADEIYKTDKNGVSIAFKRGETKNIQVQAVGQNSSTTKSEWTSIDISSPDFDISKLNYIETSILSYYEVKEWANAHGATINETQDDECIYLTLSIDDPANGVASSAASGYLENASEELLSVDTLLALGVAAIDPNATVGDAIADRLGDANKSGISGAIQDGYQAYKSDNKIHLYYAFDNDNLNASAVVMGYDMLVNNHENHGNRLLENAQKNNEYYTLSYCSGLINITLDIQTNNESGENRWEVMAAQS